jgi:sulfonate transport system permease protein
MSAVALDGPAITGVAAFFRKPRLHGLKPWVLPIALLLVWDLLARRNVGQGLSFVTIDQLGVAFADAVLSGELAANVATSLGRVAIGVVGGALLGIALGSAMGLNSVVDRVVGPVFHAIRQVPTLAWIPLLGLWFGYGELPKLLIVTKAAMFPMVLGTYEGLRTVGTAEVEVGRVLTFDRWTMFRRVRLPAALPMMLTGLQQGLGFAWVACIGTEILFGSGLGIGALIEDGQIQGRMETVLLGVIFVGVIAALINTLFTRVAAHQLRWRDIRDRS